MRSIIHFVLSVVLLGMMCSSVSAQSSCASAQRAFDEASRLEYQRVKTRASREKALATLQSRLDRDLQTLGRIEVACGRDCAKVIERYERSIETQARRVITLSKTMAKLDAKISQCVATLGCIPDPMIRAMIRNAQMRDEAVARIGLLRVEAARAVDRSQAACAKKRAPVETKIDRSVSRRDQAAAALALAQQAESEAIARRQEAEQTLAQCQR